MKSALIWCFFSLVLIEAKVSNLIQLQRCVSHKSKEIRFSCQTKSQTPSGSDWQCGQFAEQPHFCNSQIRNFTLNKKVFKGDKQVNKLNIANLNIQRVNGGGKVSSELIMTFNASHNQMGSIPDLVSMPFLTTIDLSHNRISTLSSGMGLIVIDFDWKFRYCKFCVTLWHFRRSGSLKNILGHIATAPRLNWNFRATFELKFFETDFQENFRYFWEKIIRIFRNKISRIFQNKNSRIFKIKIYLTSILKFHKITINFLGKSICE